MWINVLLRGGAERPCALRKVWQRRDIVPENFRRRIPTSGRGNSVLLAYCGSFGYNFPRGDRNMETKDVILQLRNQDKLSQEELAEKLFVTRQAVSRWENGETLPNTETLKRLSALFDVSINTLLGSPRQNICQCCGMPLEDAITSHEPDGSFNEEYCKWCYSGGEFKYESAEQLINFCVEHMATEAWPAEQVRAHMEAVVPQLKHWKR